MILCPWFQFEEFLVSSDHPELVVPVEDLDTDTIVNIMRLGWGVMFGLRERFGPIVISSGHRSRELNAAVGGKENGRHMSGCATDFRFLRYPVDKVWKAILDGDVRAMWDRLAFYEGRGRFHVDINPDSAEQRGLLYLADGGWRPAQT